MNATLTHYAQLLLKWNQTHNLSGAKTLQAVQDNIDDCLYPLNFIAPFETALDVGSGAGFPAIPLAISCPQSFFFLTEPRKKRASFLSMLCLELHLDNVKVYPCLLQDAKIPKKVDLITSRAVASTPFLLKITTPFLSSQGAFLFYKGSNLLNEGENIAKEELFTSNNERIYFYRRMQ